MENLINNVSAKSHTYLSNTEKDIYEFEGESSHKESHYNENTKAVNMKLHSDSQHISKDTRDEVSLSTTEAGAAFQFFQQKSTNLVKDNKEFGSWNQKKNQEYSEMMPSYVLNTSVISNSKKTTEGSEEFNPNLFALDTIATHFESPLGRLNRLQVELKELRDFINDRAATQSKSTKLDDSDLSNSQIIENGESHDLFFGVDPSILMNEIASLEARLLSLSGDPNIRLLFEQSDPITTKESGYTKIKNHLERSLDYPDISPTDDKTDVKEGKNELITYELYTERTMKPILENSRILSLENRITKLESQLGVNKLGFLPFGDLTTTIEQISSRLTSLDHKKIEAINSRMQILLVDLEAVNTKRKELTGLSVDDHKIDFLYDICNHWKLIAFTTPSIVKRLQTLKLLHQETNGINSRLKLMEHQMEEMKKDVELTKNNFEEIKNLIYENTEWAKRITEGLNRRFNEL